MKSYCYIKPAVQGKLYVELVPSPSKLVCKYPIKLHSFAFLVKAPAVFVTALLHLMLALFMIYLKLFVPHKTLQCSDGNISDKRRQNYSSANMIRVYYGATMTQWLFSRPGVQACFAGIADPIRIKIVHQFVKECCSWEACPFISILEVKNIN